MKSPLFHYSLFVSSSQGIKGREVRMWGQALVGSHFSWHFWCSGRGLCPVAQTLSLHHSLMHWEPLSKSLSSLKMSIQMMSSSEMGYLKDGLVWCFWPLGAAITDGLGNVFLSIHSNQDQLKRFGEDRIWKLPTMWPRPFMHIVDEGATGLVGMFLSQTIN